MWHHRGMNWRFVARGLVVAFGLFSVVSGIVHMRTPGYAPTHFHRGALVTPSYEIVWGFCIMALGLFVPFTKYGP